jgi:exodeoxyribonuclease-3
MKIISWNVNGIRACVQKGFLDYLRIENPDIIGLQEVKATEEQNPISLDLAGLGYHIFWNSAQKKGYSGTAVFTKIPPKQVFYGLDHVRDAEGRVLILEFETFFLVNVYTPNAKSELERLDYRITWDRDFLARMKQLQQQKPVVFMGDLNVAHREIDLTNPKVNRGNAGFTDEERA